MEQIDNIKDKVSKYVNKKTIIMCFICIVIGFLSYWLLFGRTNVHDNRNTINTANEQLNRTREYQSDVIRSITEVRDGIERDIETVNRAEERTDNITESAIRIQEQNGDIYDAIRESTERIKQSKQVLEEVRATKK